MENILYLELFEMLTSLSKLGRKNNNKTFKKIAIHKLSSNLCSFLLKNNSHIIIFIMNINLITKLIMYSKKDFDKELLLFLLKNQTRF